MLINKFPPVTLHFFVFGETTQLADVKPLMQTNRSGFVVLRCLIKGKANYASNGKLRPIPGNKFNHHPAFLNFHYSEF